MKVIDVSKYNGSINWDKVAKNCDGAIIRAGYRGYDVGKLVTDPEFKKNIAGATAAGVPIGVYFVTQAISVEEAKEEAQYTVKLVKGYKLAFPIFVDSEDGNIKATGRADRGKLSKTKRTEILKAFCDEITKAGYISGIYTGEYWLKTYLDESKLKKYYLWVAKYSKSKPSTSFNAWQYTDAGKINGITGKVDISDFSPISKPKTKKKTNAEIADEVIAGKWSSGDDRKKKLEAAGYDYRTIQDLVNKKLKGGKK